MKTILIGYEIRKGTFKSKDTGEDVAYSNRNLRFITDIGANETDIGFSQFIAEKMKLSQLAQILKVPENDEAVNKALSALLSKEVNTQFAPVAGTMKLVWFAPVS